MDSKPFDREVAAEYVVRQLTRHTRREDLIREVCRRTGLGWKEGEQFVSQVEREQGGRIASGRRPLLLIIGIGTLVGGLGLAAYAVFATVSGRILFVPGVPIPYSGNVAYFVTGAAMLVAGAWGVLRTLGSSDSR